MRAQAYIAKRPWGGVLNVQLNDIPDPVFSNNTWAAIRRATDARIADRFWTVGQLSRYERLQGPIAGTQFDLDLNYRIVDLKPDRLVLWQAQNRDGIEIALTDQYYGQMIWNDQEGIVFNVGNRTGLGPVDASINRRTIGGYAASYLNLKVCPDYYHALPETLRNAMRAVQIWADNVGEGNELPDAITSLGVGVYAPDQCELYGANSWCANIYTQHYISQWEWIRRGNWVLSKRSANTAAPAQLLLRTSSTYSSYCTNKQAETGSLNAGDSNKACGFKPAFQI